MPELPEVEAWRRALNDPVSAFPIEQAGPAHIATLKTFDPPLSALEGRRFAGAERRAKRLLFPTEDGELVLLVHLMSAGRIRYLLAGEKGPKTAAFRLSFQGGGELVLTEGGPKKRAGRLAADARGRGGRARAPRPGGARPGRGAARRDPRLGAAAAALAPARPAHRSRDRSRLGERDPPHGEAVPVRPGPGTVPGTGLAARRGDRLRARARPRATRARREGRPGLPRAQEAARALPRLRHADRARRLRGAHDLLLPAVPDRRAPAQGPAAVASAALRAEPVEHDRPLLVEEVAAALEQLEAGVREPRGDVLAVRARREHVELALPDARLDGTSSRSKPQGLAKARSSSAQPREPWRTASVNDCFMTARNSGREASFRSTSGSSREDLLDHAVRVGADAVDVGLRGTPRSPRGPRARHRTPSRSGRPGPRRSRSSPRPAAPA